MSWFGGGKSKEPERTVEPEPSFDTSAFESGTNFASGGGGGSGGGGAAGSMADLQVCWRYKTVGIDDV